jgi:proline dehydrogenase
MLKNKTIVVIIIKQILINVKTLIKKILRFSIEFYGLGVKVRTINKFNFTLSFELCPLYFKK